MNDDEYAVEEDEVEEGLPNYMSTFADLMALLMCFFVLLLSFSEMDALKYKEVIKSIENAFGVHRQFVAPEVPEGTSIITQEYSPGDPVPTPIKIIDRQTGDQNQNLLKKISVMKEAAKRQREEVEREAAMIALALKDAVSAGLIEVEANQGRIVIRIREQGSFRSGDATFNDAFIPVLGKISQTIAPMTGMVAVSGHTDNLPISNDQFESNWALSTARSTSVVHQLEKMGDLDPDRLMIEGHADKDPVADNSSSEGRAKNRRVEITLIKSLGDGEEITLDTLEGLTSPEIAETPAPGPGTGDGKIIAN